MKGLGILALLGVGAYFLLKKSNPATQATEIEQAWIARMLATPEWLAAIETKAIANGISTEEQLLLDAKWAIAQGWTL